MTSQSEVSVERDGVLFSFMIWFGLDFWSDGFFLEVDMETGNLENCWSKLSKQSTL